MNNTHGVNHQLKHALQQFFDLSKWNCPCAVTLTMKLAIPASQGLVHITEALASQNLRHFLNVLNKRIYGNKVNRGQRLFVIAVSETDSSGRRHYHLTLDCPPSVNSNDFGQFIQSIWTKTDWGYRQIDCQPFADEGWIDYITKYRSKSNYAHSVDWNNCHLPTSPNHLSKESA